MDKLEEVGLKLLDLFEDESSDVQRKKMQIDLRNVRDDYEADISKEKLRHNEKMKELRQKYQKRLRNARNST